MHGEIDGSSGQTFGDIFHQQEICRTGKDELTRCSVTIDGLFDGNKKLGTSLCLVNCERLIRFNKAVRVFAGRSKLREIVEGYVSSALKLFLLLEKGAFSRLSHAG